MKQEEILEKIKMLSIEKLAQMEYFLNENTKEKITPEKRLIEMFNGLTIKIDRDEYPDSIFFFKGDHCFFEIENWFLWCSSENVWSVFESEFKLTYIQIKELIIEMMEDHFKMRSITPEYGFEIRWKRMEDHFKMRSITPEYGFEIRWKRMEDHFKMRSITPKEK